MRAPLGGGGAAESELSLFEGKKVGRHGGAGAMTVAREGAKRPYWDVVLAFEEKGGGDGTVMVLVLEEEVVYRLGEVDRV